MEEKTLSMMKSSVSLLLSLINDILDLAKLENEKFELDNAKLSLKALLDKVKQLFVLQAEGKGLKLTVDIDPSATDLEIVSDERRITQILLNLLSNALKFTTEGSIRIKAQRDGDAIKIAVKDTGCGITDADKV